MPASPLRFAVLYHFSISLACGFAFGHEHERVIWHLKGWTWFLHRYRDFSVKKLLIICYVLVISAILRPRYFHKVFHSIFWKTPFCFFSFCLRIRSYGCLPEKQAAVNTYTNLILATVATMVKLRCNIFPFSCFLGLPVRTTDLWILFKCTASSCISSWHEREWHTETFYWACIRLAEGILLQQTK